MRIDELQRGLASARDAQMPADPLTGRRRVDRHVRRQRFERVGIAAIIIVLLAGAGVFLATRGTDEQRVISGPDAIPHYLPDPLPDGSYSVVELPSVARAEAGEPERQEEVVAWTNDESSLPGANSSVMWLNVTTYFDRSASPSAPQTSEQGDVRTTHWVDDHGRMLVLSGKRIAQADYYSALTSAAVDADGVATIDPPPGYREVARLLYPFPLGNDFELLAEMSVSEISALVDPAQPGYVAVFEPAPDVPPAVSGAVLDDSRLWLLAAVADLESVEVRGRSGFVLRLQGYQVAGSSTESIGGPREMSVDRGVILFWWESDHVLLGVSAADQAKALSLAESMREVDQATWERFVASAQPLSVGQATSQTFSSVGTAMATPSPTTVP